MNVPIMCRSVSNAQDLASCMAIRQIVFVEGQNVPADLERDGLEDQCLHYLAEMDGDPVATARVMPLEGKFKFQRVAVLKNYRGTGLGEKLMRFMMDNLAQREDAAGRIFFLSSQVSAIGFYEKLGFAICSDEYEDAGIQHRDMKRMLSN